MALFFAASTDVMKMGVERKEGGEEEEKKFFETGKDLLCIVLYRYCSSAEAKQQEDKEGS